MLSDIKTFLQKIGAWVSLKTMWLSGNTDVLVGLLVLALGVALIL